MDDNWLGNYRARIQSVPDLDQVQFQDAINARSPDDSTAARAICGSFLRMALQVAEDEAPTCPPTDFLGLVQDANAALMGAIESFNENQRDAFVPYAQERIRERLRRG